MPPNVTILYRWVTVVVWYPVQTEATTSLITEEIRLVERAYRGFCISF